MYADTERPDGKIGRADLLRLAEAVTLGPPRDLESSRLSWAGGGVVGALGMLALTLALGV